MRENYGWLEGRIGRGLVFHIAPGNVAVNFAYSLAAGLLSGNANIVRLPSKQFEQVDLICGAIEATLGKHPEIAPLIEFTRYGHDKGVTDEISARCDVRVIWGGDDTINEIRKSPLRPRAVEIAFPDRYSILLIDADRYIAKPDKDAVARAFYNDTFLSDQNACTSPKLVVWLGKGVEEAQEAFWARIGEYAGERYELQGVQAVFKLSRMMMLAAKFSGVKCLPGGDNLINRVQIGQLSEEVFEYCGHSGFFMEYHAESIADILPVCGEKLQTLSYLGVDPSEITEFIDENAPKGIDRIVPMGRTMDFSLVWDGYDLIYSMTRAISLARDSIDVTL